LAIYQDAPKANSYRTLERITRRFSKCIPQWRSLLCISDSGWQKFQRERIARNLGFKLCQLAARVCAGLKTRDLAGKLPLLFAQDKKIEGADGNESMTLLLFFSVVIVTHRINCGISEAL